jgi:vacuolar-type H+-ATPase subunit C/Vma6
MFLAREGWADQDFLSAMVHGRRARLAEGDRLDTLVRLRTFDELVREVAPESNAQSVVDLQRYLVTALSDEVCKLGVRAGGETGAVILWYAARFYVENLKVLARGMATKANAKDLQAYLVPVAQVRPLDATAFLTADGPESFAALIGESALRNGVLAAAEAYRRQPHPFFIEMGLDFGYLKQLVRLTKAMPADDREECLPVLRQEVDMFHLMLIARGKFTFGMKPEALAAFHIPGAGMSLQTFLALAGSHDLAEIAGRVVGLVIDEAPGAGHAESRGVEAAELEMLAWNRFRRLANWAMRRSHMGVAAVVGYVGLRRVEVANLIMLSEDIRLGVTPEVLRGRLIPHSAGEAARA